MPPGFALGSAAKEIPSSLASEPPVVTITGGGGSGATAKLTVTSLAGVPGTSSVYEGVARATGTFDGQPVSGTAWNEQAAR
jgi:hypothetical protein